MLKLDRYSSALAIGLILVPTGVLCHAECFTATRRAPVKAVCGRVHDPVDEPVANIELELTSDAGSPHFSTKSDSKGNFSFRSIPKGDYTLHAEAHGFVKAGRKLRVTVNRRAKCAPKITIRLGIGDDCGSPITIKGFDGPAELESERQQYYRSRKQLDPKQ